MASESVTDPQGRYVRSSEELGRGAYKVVYKAIDRDLGLEVAWNQIRLEQGTDFEKLWKEINILEQLKHPNIIVFHHSWVDEQKFQVIFITEFMTSGTLKQFIKKAQGVRLRVIKNWCLQILDGLNYLHTRDPPIIHRDIKCDNIFINGSLGQVKIGDLGLATILNQSGAMMKQSIIGTPEFMAPEYYEEKYDEKVDIWAFGMSVLEMATMDYPFCECDNPAQIFKKVSTGQKPRSLARIADPDVYTFIDDCLQAIEHRSSAAELLKHPFLQNIDDEGNNRLIELRSEAETTDWLERLKKDAIPFEFRPSWQKRAIIGSIKPNAGVPVGPSAAEAGVSHLASSTASSGSNGPLAPAAGVATMQTPHVVVTNPDDLHGAEEEEEDEFDFDGDDFEEDDEDDYMDDDVAFSHTTPPIMPISGGNAAAVHYGGGHIQHPSQQHPLASPAPLPQAQPSQLVIQPPATLIHTAPATTVSGATQVIPPGTIAVGHGPGVVPHTHMSMTPDDTISLKIDAGLPPAGVPSPAVPSDPYTVNLKCSLTIGRQLTVIEFEYNIVKDTPLLVATEMARELQLGDNTVPDIAAYLETKVAEYVQQRNLPVRPVTDDRLRVLREQYSSQATHEPLRLNSPARASPQSRHPELPPQPQLNQIPGPVRRTQSASGQRRRRQTETGAALANGVNPRSSASAGATGHGLDRTHVRRKSRSKPILGVGGIVMKKSHSQSNVIVGPDGHHHLADALHSNGVPGSTIHLEELQDFKKLVESNNANFENALAAFDSVSLAPGLSDDGSPSPTEPSVSPDPSS